MIHISVVIATRNRAESLRRLLKCLALQSYPIAEVILVDSSAQPVTEEELATFNLPIKIFRSPPSLCAQRNLGVQEARYDWILLCDDDIELPADYAAVLAAFAETNRSARIISGLFLELDEHNRWTAEHPPSFKALLWNVVFQLPVWADFNRLQYGGIFNGLSVPLKRFFLRRHNTFTLAGWPLVVDFHSPVFRTSVYSLGAALIKRECLVESPFDERLESHGIGEHYGVTLNLHEQKPIHVLPEALAYHHKSPLNRLNYPEAYARRIFALHYFMRKSRRFTSVNTLFLLWSLVGNFLRQLLRREFALASASLQTLGTIALGNNPYLKGFGSR